MVSTIEVDEEVVRRLEALRKRLGAPSLSRLIEMLLEEAEKKLGEFKGNPEVFISSLRAAGEAGELDSERVDELLYGRGPGVEHPH